MRAAVCALLALLAPAVSCAAGPPRAATSLRGLTLAPEGGAWASGAPSALLRHDAGAGTWTPAAPPEPERRLDFRDVAALADGSLLLMAAGTGADSGLWRSVDSGRRWTRVLDCPWPEGFFDGMAFWNEREGLLVGDPVDGALMILRTEDGGLSWRHLREAAREHAVPGEFAFAASGTSVCVGPDGRAWIGTGGVGAARVWCSADGGRNWETFDTPLFQGLESAGVFSVAFADAERGVIVGGDYLRPDDGARAAAWTGDGGRTWTLAAAPPGGYRSCVAAWAGGFLCTGPNGSDWSEDGGRTWRRVGEGFHVVAPPFAAGAEGRLGRFERP